MSAIGPTTTASVLRQYAEALKCMYDGCNAKTVRGELFMIADALDERGLLLSHPETVDHLRKRLGLCPGGGGHFDEYGESCDRCPEQGASA